MNRYPLVIGTLALSLAVAGCAATPIEAWWQLKSAPARALSKRHSTADVVVLRKHAEHTMHYSAEPALDYMIIWHHQALMVLTERGLSRADWRIQYAETSKLLHFEARVVRPSGRTEPLLPKDVREDTAAQRDGEKSKIRMFALPRVKVGDIIEVKYALKWKGRQSRQYHHQGYLHGPDPVLDASWVYRFTKGTAQYDFKLYNYDKRAWTRETRGGYDVVSLRLRNLPAYVAERWSPPKRDFVPRWTLTVAVRKVGLVEYPQYRTWDDAIEGTHYFECLYGKYSESLLKGFVVPKRATSHSGGREQIAAALRWVRDEVTFGAPEKFKPRPLRYVISDGKADDYEKTLLLLYALRSQKLEADFALVRPRDYGVLDIKRPAPNQFTEAVVYVPAQSGIDRPLWIAPYCHHCRLGEMPSAMIGEPALIVRAEKKSGDEKKPRVKLEKVEGKHPTPATIMRLTTIHLRPDGSATGQTRWRNRGRFTNNTARMYGKPRAKAKLAKVMAKIVPGSKLGKLKSKISRSPDFPGKLDVSFTADNLALPAGPNKLAVPLTPIELSYLLEDKQRHNPIWVRDRKRFVRRVRIVPPPGYRVVVPELPSPLTTKYGKVTFAVVESAEPSNRKLPQGAIEVSMDTQFAPGTHPANQHQAFRRFLLHADSASRLLVSLVKERVEPKR